MLGLVDRGHLKSSKKRPARDEERAKREAVTEGFLEEAFCCGQSVPECRVQMWEVA